MYNNHIYKERPAKRRGGKAKTMDYRFSSAFANLAPSAIREILKNAGDPSVIAFAAGNPNAASFPLDDIRQLVADILDRTRRPAVRDDRGLYPPARSRREEAERAF